MTLSHILIYLCTPIIALTACGNTPTQSVTNEPAAPQTPATQSNSEPQTAEQVADGDSAKADHIVISKEELMLKLYDSDNRLICAFPVATGKNVGNKRKVGDMKTPEGEFSVCQIQKASYWEHDFGDGKGSIKGAYGNWFIRLLTPPHKGIGIHGTHAPESIGSRATEGCIRLNNKHLDSLKPMVKVGMKVTILPAQADIDADAILDGKSVATTPAQATPVSSHPAEVKSLHSKTTQSSTTAKQSGATPTKSYPTAEGEVWHTVRDGDLVVNIAKMYGITTAQIKALNPDINIDRISIGQRIRVK